MRLKRGMITSRLACFSRYFLETRVNLDLQPHGRYTPITVMMRHPKPQTVDCGVITLLAKNGSYSYIGKIQTEV